MYNRADTEVSLLRPHPPRPYQIFFRLRISCTNNYRSQLSSALFICEGTFPDQESRAAFRPNSCLCVHNKPDVWETSHTPGRSYFRQRGWPEFKLHTRLVLRLHGLTLDLAEVGLMCIHPSQLHAVSGYLLFSQNSDLRGY